jgi:hypothetical protein
MSIHKVTYFFPIREAHGSYYSSFSQSPVDGHGMISTNNAAVNTLIYNSLSVQAQLWNKFPVMELLGQKIKMCFCEELFSFGIAGN